MVVKDLVEIFYFGRIDIEINSREFGQTAATRTSLALNMRSEIAEEMSIRCCLGVQVMFRTLFPKAPALMVTGKNLNYS